MTTALRAALLSALVFPGAGQWLLQGRRRAALLQAGTTILLLASALGLYLRRVLSLLANMTATSDAALSALQAHALLWDAAWPPGRWLGGACLLLALAWSASVVDALLATRR